MAVFYRIVGSHRATTALDGEGARKFGGRWNPAGVPVAYLTESRALSALEILVHFGRDVAKASWKLVEIDIPEDLIEEISFSKLPKGWNDLSSPMVSKRLGADWVEGASAVALLLPSAIIPEERIVMLNVRHPGISKIKSSKPVPFFFDPRLGGKQ